MPPSESISPGNIDHLQLLGVVHGLLARDLLEQKFSEQYRSVGVASVPSERHPHDNQDAYVCEPRLGLYGVFDGLGGVLSGSWASHYSAIRIKHSIEHIRQTSDRLRPGDVRRALSEVNFELYEHGQGRSSLTTATIAVERQLADGNTELLIASAGDSRAYLFREGILYPLTVDNCNGATLRHPIADSIAKNAMRKTFANQRLLAEYVSRENIPGGGSDKKRLLEKFKDRSIVHGSLGENPFIGKTNVTKVAIKAGDTLLLITDGVHDNLTESQIQRLLQAASNKCAEQIAELLVSESSAVSVCYADEERSQPDDMTAVVVQYA